MQQFIKFIFGMKLYVFRTVRLPIIRSFFTVHTANPVWHIPFLCVRWKTPDDGQNNCPKHVEFYSKIKFEELVHLFGFVIRTVFGSTDFCVIKTHQLH